MVTTTRYIYDGNQYLAEADETDTINRLYTNEPDAYTHLISQEEVSTGDTLTYHYDALGSTRTVTDETEAVTDEFTYDAWGNRLLRSGTNDIPFQYVGEHGYYREDATDSYYVMARTYQPSIGRWTSMDPKQVTVNLFNYSNNSPSNFIDSSGLISVASEPIQKVTAVSLPQLPNVPLPKIPNLPMKALVLLCKKWSDNEKKDADWLNALPACPCHLSCVDNNDWTDPKAIPTHPGSDVCVRSKNKVNPLKPCSAGQQCCYSSGHLVTEGPGAGTPDKTSPSPLLCAGKHYADDVHYYLICKKANRLDLYLDARPPNNSIGCEPFSS